MDDITEEELRKRIEQLGLELKAGSERIASALRASGCEYSPNPAYMGWLNRLSEAEAVEHLIEVQEEGAQLTQAYTVLSKRLDPQSLVKVCRSYLYRDTLQAKLTGASELGLLLFGTGDIRVAAELAQVVRDQRSHLAIRAFAYQSIQQIMFEGTEGQWLKQQPTLPQPSEVVFQQIDWDFVDSFLG